MYALIAGNQFSNYVVRLGLSSLIQVRMPRFSIVDGVNHRALIRSCHR